MVQAPQEAPDRAPDTPRARGLLPWFVTRLENGLTVIIDEVRSRPVVWVGLEVLGGSRDEQPDEYGGAHFLEHVFYMGTPTRKRRQIRDDIDDRGGSTLAMTDYDRTEYWALCRTEDWRLALDGLADGARNALVDPGEVEQERSIIFDELQKRLDDNPTFGNEELARLVFRPHSYARRRAGELPEVRRLTRDHLHGIYRRHYRPDQFVVIITGDVETAAALEAVREEFGDLQNPDAPLPAAPFLAPATGFEHAFFERDTEQTYVCIGCPIPGMAHADAAACDMMFKFLEARVYWDLVVMKRLATSARGSAVNFRDLGLLEFTITPSRHEDAGTIERLVYEAIHEVGRVPTGRPGWDEESELARYQRQQRLSLAFDQQDAGSRGGNLAWGATMGTLAHLANYEARLDAVTLADVARCAQTYCAARHLNSVVIGPAAARASAAQLAERHAALAAIAWEPGSAPDWLERAPTGVAAGWQESRLANGLRVLVRTAPDFPLVTVGLFLPGGSADDPVEREGRAWFANSMLTIDAAAVQRLDGTPGSPWNRSRFGDLLQRLGSRYWKGTAREYSHHLLTVRRADLVAALDMLSAGVVAPTYPEAELKVEVEEVLGALRREADDLYQTALRHARRRVYGPSHPYAVSERGRPESVAALTREDLVDAYYAGCIPQGAVLVFDGDITPREAHELARAAFTQWNPQRPAGAVSAPLQGVVPDFTPMIPGRSEHHMDKTQAMVVLATPAVAYGSTGYPAADLARSLLGEWAFKELIYDKKVGYSAGCVLEASRHGGACFLFVECNPEGRAQAAAELHALIQRLVRAPVPLDEFARAQRRLVGSRPLQLQTGMARVSDAGGHAVFGLAPDYADEYLAAVAALTPAALHEAVREWLDPERLAEVHVHRDAPRRDR